MKKVKDPINIFITSDENYIRYLAITMAGILYNTKSFCRFYVFADNVSKYNKLRIENIKNRFDNFDIIWLDLDDKQRQCIIDTYIKKSKNTCYTKNVSNYSRFLMPDLLPDVKRAIYVDTDVLVYDDILDLYNQDLSGYEIGAVTDSYVYSDKDVQNSIKEYISPKHIYFNAGILLIDCEKWRKNKTFNRIAQIDEKIRDKKLFNTQDPLNKLFECNYKNLPHKYNWFGPLPSDKENDIVIRHFPGQKPDVVPENYTLHDVANLYFFASMTDFFQDIKIAKNYHKKPDKHVVYKIKLFGFIPFIKVINNKVYLFNFIKLCKVIK